MEEMEIKLVRLCPGCGPVTDYDEELKCKACGQHTKEEVIAGEAGIGALPPIAEVEFEERRERRKKRMCLQYGKEIDADAKFCQYCGINIPATRVSDSTITSLAAIGGIFGFHGLGHTSVGKILTGFLMLFAGWALIIGALISFFMGWREYGETAYIALIGVLAIAYIFLFIWQVMDASALARKHNLDYENHKAA